MTKSAIVAIAIRIYTWVMGWNPSERSREPMESRVYAAATTVKKPMDKCRVLTEPKTGISIRCCFFEFIIKILFHFYGTIDCAAFRESVSPFAGDEHFRDTGKCFGFFHLFR